MPLSVLTDDEIRILLEHLTLDELESFTNELRFALHQYSTNTQSIDDNLIHQPHRTSVRSPTTGATTLFMPSCSTAGHGVKVITLSSAGGQKSVDPQLPIIRPTGAITLFAPDGRPTGILHASTLTAFRTALASACLLIRRNTVRTVTVFGCGEQAYWHVRLALLLRGSTIRQVNIINHRFGDSCRAILARFYGAPRAAKRREGWEEAQFGILTPGYGEYPRLLKEQLRAADVVFCCTPSTVPLFEAAILTSREGRRKGRLVVAIGSYTPQMHELPIDLLRQATRTHEKGHHHYHKHAMEGGVIVVDTLDGALKEAGEIIEARLEPTQLVELGELVMIHKSAVAEDEEAETGSVASFPSVPSAELEKFDLSPSGTASAMSSVFSSEGAPSSSRTPSPSRRESGHFSLHRSNSSRSSTDRQKRKDNRFARWLQEGNVIYKSVGLGLMDLTVGLKVIELAKKKGVGSHIEGF